jgi:hypothetical protein
MRDRLPIIAIAIIGVAFTVALLVSIVIGAA